VVAGQNGGPADTNGAVTVTATIAGTGMVPIDSKPRANLGRP
jgi:hypothetical protein